MPVGCPGLKAGVIASRGSPSKEDLARGRKGRGADPFLVVPEGGRQGLWPFLRAASASPKLRKTWDNPLTQNPTPDTHAMTSGRCEMCFGDPEATVAVGASVFLFLFFAAW